MINILMLSPGNSVYDAPFTKFGNLVYATNKLEDCDLVVFTGGEDVSPSLYGDKAIAKTGNNPARDKREQEVFTMAALLEIPMVGICRGAQFLNVMNGGVMVQDINGHGIFGTHPITTHDGKTIHVTSTHHQMMLPQGNHILLGWAESISSAYETGDNISVQEMGKSLFQGGIFKEPECVWWPNTSCLGVQYHPEYMNKDSDGWLYFQDLLTKYIFKFH